VKSQITRPNEHLGSDPSAYDIRQRRTRQTTENVAGSPVRSSRPVTGGWSVPTLAIVVAIATPGLGASRAEANDRTRSFTAAQPAIAIPLAIKKNGLLERVRINVPELVESIEILPGRRVHFAKLAAQEASVDSKTGRVDLVIELEEAEAIASPTGKVEMVRAMHLFHERERIASLEIKSTLDLFGLGEDVPHLTVVDARVERLSAGTDLFESAKLAGGGVIATPVFPLELLLSVAEATPKDDSPSPASTIGR
jgi:hypothetical protein